MNTEFLTNGDDDEVQPPKKYVNIIEEMLPLQHHMNKIMFRLDNTMIKGIRNKVVEEAYTKATDSDESAIHYIKSKVIKPTSNSEYSEERKRIMIESGHGDKFKTGIKGKPTRDAQRGA